MSHQLQNDTRMTELQFEFGVTKCWRCGDVTGRLAFEDDGLCGLCHKWMNYKPGSAARPRTDPIYTMIPPRRETLDEDQRKFRKQMRSADYRAAHPKSRSAA